jgi:hypothetical protein
MRSLQMSLCTERAADLLTGGCRPSSPRDGKGARGEAIMRAYMAALLTRELDSGQ